MVFTPLGDDLLVRLGIRADSRQVAVEQAKKGEGGTKTGQEPTAPGGVAKAPNTEAAKEPVKEPLATEATSKPPADLVKQPGGETPEKPTATAPPGTQAPPKTEKPSKPEKEGPPVASQKQAETPATATPLKVPNKSGVPPKPQLPAAPDHEAGKTPGPKPEGELSPVGPEPLGRLMSSEQVLLSADTAGDWTRVGPNQMLVPQPLLVLPTYRVKVALTAGVTLDILGPARVRFVGQQSAGFARHPRSLWPGGADAAGPGRGAVAGGVWRPQRHDHLCRSRVGRRDRRAAPRAPGTNPESGPSRIAADLYATTGGISWEETGDGKSGEPVRLAPLQRLSFDAQATSAPTAVKELPKWVTAEPIKPLDRKASAAIAQYLTSDRPARVGLLELATSRPQKEVKWLALRCLGCVGQFRDMVTALNEPAHKLEWSDYYVDELCAAVGRDAETATAVRLALEQQYPQQAPRSTGCCGAIPTRIWRPARTRSSCRD